jgi:hypothetical protein
MIENDIKHFIKEHSYLFYTFLNDMAVPEFSKEIDTACVIFNGDNENYKFLINEEFWNKLNFFSKSFLISHEIMHVLLKHGKRGKQFLNSIDEKNKSHNLLNVCMDISINEILLRELDFTKDLLNFPQDGCFVNTVFKPNDILNENIVDDESFDYYYHLYTKLYGLKEPPPTLDDHSTFSSENKPSNKKDNETDFDDAEQSNEEDIIDSLLEGEEDFFSSDSHGSEEEASHSINIKSKSLEDYFKISIKSSSKMKIKYKEKHVWHGYNRRISPIMSSIDPKISIPSTMKQPNNKKEKHKILIYLDTSYSCFQESNNLLTLAANLPDSKFDIQLFSFSNSVQEVKQDKYNTYTLSNKGATNILAVCNHANNLLSNEKFDAVFVLTDAEFLSLKISDFFDYKKWFFFIIPFPNRPHITNTIPYKVKRFLIPEK